MKKNSMRRIIAMVVFVATLIINGLAGSTTLLNGWNTAAVSAAYPSLFTPAGYTFAIWGVIYALMLGYFGYQFGLFGKLAKDKERAVDTITPYVIALSVVNAAWIFVWQYTIMWLAVVFIVAMLVLLVRINKTLRTLEYSPREYALLRAPFSVYFGWLTVATVANICVWLVSSNWNGWGVDPTVWLITVLWVAAVIGMGAVLRNRDWVYGLVFVWAYIGILLSNEQFSIAVVANLAFLTAALAGVSGYVLAPVSSKKWRKHLFER